MNAWVDVLAYSICFIPAVTLYFLWKKERDARKRAESNILDVDKDLKVMELRGYLKREERKTEEANAKYIEAVQKQVELAEQIEMLNDETYRKAKAEIYRRAKEAEEALKNEQRED